MSREKAIELVKKAIELRPVCRCAACWLENGRHSPDCAYDETIDVFSLLIDLLAELSKQPEPTEFTKMLRSTIADSKQQPTSPVVQCLQHQAEEACDIIEAATAENKQLKEYIRHKRDCAVNLTNKVLGIPNKCNCGLEQALKVAEDEQD